MGCISSGWIDYHHATMDQGQQNHQLVYSHLPRHRLALGVTRGCRRWRRLARWLMHRRPGNGHSHGHQRVGIGQYHGQHRHFTALPDGLDIPQMGGLAIFPKKTAHRRKDHRSHGIAGRELGGGDESFGNFLPVEEPSATSGHPIELPIICALRAVAVQINKGASCNPSCSHRLTACTNPGADPIGTTP